MAYKIAYLMSKHGSAVRVGYMIKAGVPFAVRVRVRVRVRVKGFGLRVKGLGLLLGFGLHVKGLRGSGYAYGLMG